MGRLIVPQRRIFHRMPGSDQSDNYHYKITTNDSWSLPGTQVVAPADAQDYTIRTVIFPKIWINRLMLIGYILL